MNYITSDYWKPYESIIPKEKYIQIKERNIHSGGIQRFVRTLFNKNETKIEMLFQKNGNVGNINSFVDAL